MNKQILFVLAVVLVVGGLAGYIYMKKLPPIGPSGVVRQDGTPIPAAQTANPQDANEISLGGQIYSSINPVAALPEINPFQQEINPYKAVKTNPFSN